MLDATLFWSPGLEKQKRAPTVTVTAWRFTLRLHAPQITDPIVHLTQGARACMRACASIIMKFIFIMNLKFAFLTFQFSTWAEGRKCVFMDFSFKTLTFFGHLTWSLVFRIASKLEMDLELPTQMNGSLGLSVLGTLENNLCISVYRIYTFITLSLSLTCTHTHTCAHILVIANFTVSHPGKQDKTS